MSDRSALQLYVYAMPDEDRAAVQLGIDDNCLEPYDDSSNGIVLGMRYLTEEVPVGSAYDLAVHLLTKAPGTAFELWQDPVFQHMRPLRGAPSQDRRVRGRVRLLRLPAREADRGTRRPAPGAGQRLPLPADHIAHHAPFFTALRRVQAARRP